MEDWQSGSSFRSAVGRKRPLPILILAIFFVVGGGALYFAFSFLQSQGIPQCDAPEAKRMLRRALAENGIRGKAISVQNILNIAEVESEKNYKQCIAQIDATDDSFHVNYYFKIGDKGSYVQYEENPFPLLVYAYVERKKNERITVATKETVHEEPAPNDESEQLVGVPAEHYESDFSQINPPEDYSTARKKILALGLTPLNLSGTGEHDLCYGEDICGRYPEVVSCSGTGFNPCRLAFVSGDGRYAVGMTVGELVDGLVLTDLVWANAEDSDQIRDLQTQTNAVTASLQ